jgi:hypothetical protein
VSAKAEPEPNHIQIAVRAIRVLPLIAALSAALAVVGCGRGEDAATARAVAERFFAAVEAGDGDRACAELSPDRRSELESQEQRSCREAVTDLQLEGGGVVAIHLRQRGSPESKPVGAAHDATGAES